MEVVTLQADAAAAQPLFVDFVNTLHWYEGVPVELLGSDADLHTWVAEQHLPTPADLGAARPALLVLREHLRAGVAALVAREPMPDDAWTALQAALGGAPGL